MHHFSILFRATCITSHTVLRFLPATTAEKYLQTLVQSILQNSTPVIGRWLLVSTSVPTRLLLEGIRGQVDLHIYISAVGSCYPRVQHRCNPPCNKEPGDALLNAPSISRKTPRAYSLLFSGALSILPTRMCNLVTIAHKQVSAAADEPTRCTGSHL